MNRTGQADLPLHGGRVPYWLAKRMELLGGAITEAIVEEYGRAKFLDRLSDPGWFQAFGCVLGMDWHSSGITTSVLSALRKALNSRQKHLGLKLCGGRGKSSRQTPAQLLEFAESTGLNGASLVRTSKLSAKVDNTAIQDGYQLYLHAFILDTDGNWAIVQQGMNQHNRMARRYHWRSGTFKEYTVQPHTAISGVSHGLILNLTDHEAGPLKKDILEVVSMRPEILANEVKKIILPSHHPVTLRDINLKRLGGVLATSYEHQPAGFDELLLTPGLGPRTLQSLTLISEVIHGNPSRFEDPARFSFAHGGKDGHPFPVPTRVYDNTIDFMHKTIDKTRLDRSEKKTALKRLHHLARTIEKGIIPDQSKFDAVIQTEKLNSARWGGKTANNPPSRQLRLF